MCRVIYTGVKTTISSRKNRQRNKKNVDPNLSESKQDDNHNHNKSRPRRSNRKKTNHNNPRNQLTSQQIRDNQRLEWEQTMQSNYKQIVQEFRVTYFCIFL